MLHRKQRFLCGEQALVRPRAHPSFTVNEMMFGGVVSYAVQYSARFRRSNSNYAYFTPASGGNRQKFTVVAFVKRANSDGDHTILSVNSGGSDFFTFVLRSTGQLRAIFEAATNAYGEETPTSQIFVDPTAWNLYVLQVDTTLATAASRVRMWLWDTELTCDTIGGYTQIPQNLQTYVNHTLQHDIGRFGYSANAWMDGNMAHVRIIDGQALPGTDFCERDAATGQPIPKKFAGTVGSRDRFYDNSDATSATTLWYDASGNGLHATPSGFSVAAGIDNDQSLDTPTNNHATLNSLDYSTGMTLSRANTRATSNSGGAWQVARSTQFIEQELTYGEVTVTTLAGQEDEFLIGLAAGSTSLSAQLGTDAASWALKFQGGAGTAIYKRTNGTDTALSATGTLTATDVLMWAFNRTTGSLWFGRNGTWFDSGNPAAGTGAQFTGITASVSPAICFYGTGEDADINNGQRAWAHTPPSGFKALCTQNLPTPSIKYPADAYNEVPYSGNSSTQSIAQRFQADMIRQKCLNVGRGWRVQDAVRGFNNVLSTSDTAAQYAGSSISSVSASAVLLQNADNYNTTGENYVMQTWREGPSYGMDIVVYQGNGGTQTISHALGTVPHYIEVKPYLVAGYRWCVYHRAFGAARYGYLNENFAFDSTNAINRWGNNSSTVEPTSGSFTIGNNSDVNASGVWYIAFVFTSIPGFSAFVGYQGNTSILPFLNLGFKAKTITLKDCSAISAWRQWSLARQPQNGGRKTIYPNSGAVEQAENFINITAMGFKITVASGFGINDNGNTHLCNAFAEAPAKYAVAV